jgi:IclR family transcriptional regulator, blcABC operon repressor
MSTALSNSKVPAVDRAVRLLDYLASSRQPASLSELVRQLELPKSSLHGLLASLGSASLITKTTDNEYLLGPKVVQWAGAYSLQSDLIGAFAELAAQRPALTAETVMLAVLDGADVMYLACRQGSRALAVNFRVGGHFPASCTSSGKALLATLPDARVRALIAQAGLRRLTRQSVSSVTMLLRHLAQTRQAGYAIDDEETAQGMKCFGAAVFAAGSAPAVAAVAVSQIKAAATVKRSAETIAAIRHLAAQLTERLGGQAPKQTSPHS